MTISMKQAGLVLLVALSTGARLDHLTRQELRSPIEALLAVVREDVRTAVPPQMRPYNIGRVFLSVNPGISDRSALGSLGKANLEGLGITLVEDKSGMQVIDSVGGGGSQIRDDGVYLVVSSVERVPRTDRPGGALVIDFSYYVTIRESRRAPVICLSEWRVVSPHPWSRQADPTSQIKPSGIALTALSDAQVAPVRKEDLLGQYSRCSPV